MRLYSVYYALLSLVLIARMAFSQTFVVWNSGQDTHIDEGIPFVVKDGDFVNNSGHLHNNGRLTVHGDFNYNIDFKNQYMVIAAKPSYSNDSVSFSFNQPRKGQFSDTLYVELELQKIDSNFNPDSFLVATMYWDFDKHMLSEDAIDSIKKVYNFLGQNRGYGITITSHTDAMGSNRYNQLLSERRSQSVYNYLLTDLGFPKDRMRWNGLGEHYPVAPNRLPNGRDSKEGRQLNRRTEFWAYPIR